MFRSIFDSLVEISKLGTKYLSVFLIVAASTILTIGTLSYIIFKQAYPVINALVQKVNDTDERTMRIEEQLDIISAAQQINSHQIQQATQQATKNHRDIIFTVRYWNRLTQQEIIQEIGNNIYMPTSKHIDSIYSPMIGVRKLK
jgi:vacuolar-type H+-ATPase subunit H